MVIEEVFAISNVETLLLAQGNKSLKKKMNLQAGERGVTLSYGEKFGKTLELKKNRLVMDAEIRHVREAERVRAIELDPFRETRATSNCGGV